MSRTSDSIFQMIQSLPGDFRRIEGRPGFWFRAGNPPHLRSFIVVQHSAKDAAIGVDVVSTVLNSWNKQYGSTKIVKATGLANVRLRSGSVPMQETFYSYGHDVDPCIELIRRHLVEYAIPWFAAHSSEMEHEPLTLCGMAAIARMPTPSLDEMKSILRIKAAEIGASKRDRQETGLLAAQFLAWAEERRRLGGDN